MIFDKLQKLVTEYRQRIETVLASINEAMPMLIEEIWQLLTTLRKLSPIPIENQLIIITVTRDLIIEETHRFVRVIEVDDWNRDSLQIRLRLDSGATTLFFYRICRSITMNDRFEMNYECKQTISAMLTITKNFDIILQGVERKLSTKLEYTTRLVSTFFESLQQLEDTCKSIEAIKGVSRVEALKRELEEQPRS